MGKLRALVLVMMAGLFVGTSLAAVAEEKVAVVDMARAIFGSNAAQAKLKQAEQNADFVSLKAKYESAAADLQALAKEVETKRLTWSQEQLVEHQKKMEYSKADAELAGRKIQAEQKQLQQSVIQQLGPVAQQALQEIVKEESVTILLRAESVLIANPESNLTAKLADRLNQKTAKE